MKKYRDAEIIKQEREAKDTADKRERDLALYRQRADEEIEDLKIAAARKRVEKEHEVSNTRLSRKATEVGRGPRLISGGTPNDGSS